MELRHFKQIFVMENKLFVQPTTSRVLNLEQRCLYIYIEDMHKVN